jgi:hypothetical protein
MERLRGKECSRQGGAVRKRDPGRSSAAAVGALLVAGWLIAPVFAAAEDAKSAKKAVIAPVEFDDAKLRGDLPAGEPFLDPASLLKGKSSPRGEVLFRGEELVVEVYADDEFKLRVDEPFPHDEFIYILSGKLLLIDKAGEERKYAAGDLLMIPKGFTGIWHQSEDFRELVVIERKVYDASYLSE